MTAPGAVLLDADGTLVDSTYLHVSAWSQAFARIGQPVDSWRIHRCIGMGSDKLLAALLGDRADELGKSASELHSEIYAGTTDRIRRLDGVHELLRALRERGLRAVLSTSAPPDELEHIRRVLDAEDLLHAVTAAEDVEEAKPEPDLVTTALAKAAMPAERAVFVGDAVWDVEACKRAGVPCIGVLTGGISAGELRDAGAVAVYGSVGHLLDELDTSAVGRLLH
ncbi:HAD family hydrolase [Georgenia yuyongxinii]|uniref:HAD family hydrolase n=1 Tax=Georgenia yuyongxinii TaxID=2589797 RepID=A0A5B8CDH0_9MICO|nr:HAD family hydrolase [Georgenia yuyongxinii]QDC26236.1 HAD family hydrolase [Georgenia yuyongxinii]